MVSSAPVWIGGRGAYCQEEIADVMCDIDCDPHMREMEPVTQCNQRQGYYMMQDQFLEILSRLLQLEHEYDGLLTPVAGLQQVVCLEYSLVLAMWKSLKHGSRVKIPQGTPGHDVQAERPKDGEIYGCVDLFHKPSLLCSLSDPKPGRHGSYQPLHQKLPRKAQHNHVERDKGYVSLALAVHVRAAGIVRAKRVGEEDGSMKGILFAGIHIVGNQNGQHENKRIDPRVP